MRRLSLVVAVLVAVMVMALPLTAQEEPAAKQAQEKTAEGAEKKTQEKSAKGGAKTDIAVVEIEPFSYYAVEMTGSYTQHPDAFMKLYSEAGKQDLPMTEAPFGIYWNSPEDTAEEELKWEIGLPVPGDKEIAAPLTMKKWEHTTVVQKDFEGAIDSDEMKAVYYSIFEWIGANGYEMAGPMLEKFLNTASPNEKGEIIGKVQIIFPVRKKK